MGRPGLPAQLAAPGKGRWRKAIVRLALSVVVLAVVLAVVDLDAAIDGIRKLDALTWLGAVAGFLALHAASALKWRYMLALGDAHLGPRLALTCHAAGLFANLCMPSLIGGDVLRAGLAMSSVERRTALVVGSVVDRVADLTALLVVALVGFAWAPWAGDAVGGPGALGIFAGLLALGACGGFAAFGFVLRRARARKLPRGLARKAIEVRKALLAMRRQPGRAALGWSFCLFIQTGFVLVNVQLGAAVGLDMDLALWLLLWPLAKIAAMLPVSFGGLGVREAAFAALVAPFGPKSLAVVQSLVWQSVLIAGGLLCGAFWALSPTPRTPEPDA